MNNFDKDWEDFIFLNKYLEEGRVKYIQDNAPYFKKIIKNFPVQSYRIDWPKVKNHIEVHIGLNYPDSIEPIKSAISSIFEKEHIERRTKVFVCFDGITQGVLQMDLDIFIQYAHEVLTTPQHTYVIPDDAKWCLNYTFENYTYFGYS